MNIDLKDLHVVLVEPSATQQKLISRYLNGHGVTHIRIFETGSDALEYFYRDEPDLVISALYLPDMTGTDLVSTLRDDPTLAHIVFMLISSETSFKALDPIRQAGAVAILPKPFAEEQLRAALYSTLDLIDPKAIELEELSPEELKVLVVDDSSMARKHICRVLGSMGIEKITQAVDGTEAVAILKDQFFDLVVTDYNMPEMDGDALVKHIRTESNQSSVPVLMVTSEDNELRLAAARQAGVSALSDKPFEPGTIRALITQIISAE